MTVLFEQYWWLLVIALLIGVVVAWWAFGSGRKTRIESNLTADVLEEGAAPARRNQAFIDAPSAVAQSEIPVSPPALATPPRTEEPVPDAAPVAEESDPAPQSAPATPPASSGSRNSASTSDDLTKIKGLGPKIAQLLQDMGISRFAQIAAWTDTDIDRIDVQLGKFQGRIRRDSWVEQANLLAEDNTDEFEGRFGKV